jgi:flavin reductase (DIM6/NTAB) family NADH-FMN oxidoreductase RutF
MEVEGMGAAMGGSTTPSDGPQLPATVDAERFKAAFRHHAAGVAVVTADAGGGPIALTASSVTSVSAAPAVLLFSAASSTSTGCALATARSAVVHLLDADDHALAVRCADPTVDRFAETSEWERLPTGEPVFFGPRILLRGEVCERLSFGEATVMVLAVTHVLDRAAPGDATRPALAYVDRTWHRLGTASEIG